jgi:hypothetical protein
MKRVFGLHITRTAGTSISAEMVEKLGRSKCFLLSSFSQIQNDCQITPQEQMAISPLPTFSYGHYVHESLWAILKKNSELYSFTLYREPKDRIYSEYSHLKSLGVSDDKIFENLSQNPNPWCQEILRCFPSVNEFMPNASLSEKSLAILSLFDDVKPMSMINQVLSNIFSLYEFVLKNPLRQINSNKPSDNQITEQLKSFIYKNLDEDILLYNNLEKKQSHLEKNKELEAFILEKYLQIEEAKITFEKHLDHYFISEAKVLNLTNATMESLHLRINVIQKLINKLSTANT